MEERTDDYRYTWEGTTTGFKVKVKYSGFRVTNTVIPVRADKNFTINFMTWKDRQDYTSSVKCWSRTCNEFIKINQTSFYTETSSNLVLRNESFVYFVELVPKGWANYQAWTFTFNLTEPRPTSKVAAIKIDKDFQTWYRENRDKIPYYAPPPGREPTAKTLDQSTIEEQVSSRQRSDDVFKEVDPEIADRVETWSETDLLLAFQEARERRNRKAKANSAEVTISNQGQLSIKFKHEVYWPFYLKKEMEAMVSSDQIMKNSGKRRLAAFISTGF